ncbi:phage tail protein [Macrococcoides canis]|uniref:phage tail spike protein n=1 Tax=Macrococcoides canis TaxID=1855823 RepID=UPI00207C1581|nr:phage tail spike protein [Macrococcus canis]MCO4095703.1 phage tail protein [Macrococcus canis]UTH08412.1 phage tail protein [Macrococcus canis]
MIYLFNIKKELNKIIPRTNLISFIQELEINGLYLSEVELPLFYKTEYGQYYNHKKSFDSASFFGFFDTKKKFQMYKIHTRKVDGRLLIVSGVHLFFDEAKAMNVVRDKRLIDVDAAGATNTVFSGTGWTVKSSDVTPLKSIDFYYETPQDARSRIIESWNIEFDYDLTFDGKKITSKNIYIKKKLGVWTGDRYSYGTNILSIVQEQDEAEVFTAAIGRGTADDTNTTLNSKVLFDDLSWSKDGYTKPLGQDYIEIPSATAQYGYYDSNGNVNPRIAVIDFGDIQDQKILADKTYEWLQQNCVPKVSYQTTVAKAGDYYLGDEIGIIYKDIDIVKKARVEKIKVNMLNPKLSELGLGDYQFFKQDRFKKNIRNEISTVKKDALTGIQKIRQEFSDQFDVTKQEWEAQIQQVEINATAQVQAAETRMNEQLSSAKSELSGQISNSYSSAVQAAELKAKELDAVVTNQINSTKTILSNDIASAYNKAVTDAETKAKALDAVITQTVTANKQAADKTMTDFNAALNSTNSKVGTIEQNVTAAQQNIATLNNMTGTQQEAINQAKQDISGLTATVDEHSASISNLDNQIKLTATKTEVADAVGNIQIGGTNLLENSLNTFKRIDESFNNLTQLFRIDISHVSPKLKIGDVITVSFDVQMEKGTILKVYDSNGQIDKSFGWATFTNIGTDKKRLSFTKTLINPTKALKNWYMDFYNDNDPTNRFTIERVKIEKGNKATDYTIAPEDIESRIAKSEASIQINSDEITKRVSQTEFNTKTGQIEQTANYAKSTADSNTQTITTVKGNVDALSQWKAAKGTAIDQTINSVSNKAWLTDINPITKRIETAEASITTNANEIARRVTKTEFDSTTGRIEGVANTAKSTAIGNTQAITTVSGKVNALEQWRTDKGSQIDQAIDAVSTKVWQNDIDKLNFENRNLIPNSNFSKGLEGWTVMYGSSAVKNSGQNAYVFFNTADKFVGVRTPNFDVVAGQTYTLTIEGSRSGNMQQLDYVYMMYDISGVQNQPLAVNSFSGTSGEYTRVSATFTATTTKVGGNILIAKRPTTLGAEYQLGFYIRNVKLEKGTKATPYSITPEDAENRMTEIKQTADGALTKATTIGNDYVKQSAVLVQSDGVLIGSKKVSGAEMASAISVTPSNVDIITKVMRVTGDMAVAGDIKSLSLSAIYADIAKLRANVITADSVTSTALKVDSALINKLNTNALLTNYLAADTAMINTIKSNAVTAVRADIAFLKANIITADSITSTALKVDTALMDKLNVNSILTNKLLADTAMINAIKSNAITAVRGDIAYLKANIITADSITSTALKADLSMIDKLFASSALINQLTSKTAFIDSINAISITTNSVLINSIKGDIGKPNSGIKITRPDGAVWMENGMVKDEYMVTSTMPYFMSSLPPGAGQPNGGVLHFYQSGTYYATTRSVLAQGGTHYTDFGRLTFYRFYQKARYLVLRVVINCKNTGGVVMIRNTADTIYEIAAVAQNDSRADSNGEVIIDLIEDMGTPDYSRKNFYVYFKPNLQGTSTSEALIRIMECRITDYL